MPTRDELMFVREAYELEAEEAIEAGSLGLRSRLLPVQSPVPGPRRGPIVDPSGRSPEPHRATGGCRRPGRRSGCALPLRDAAPAAADLAHDRSAADRGAPGRARATRPRPSSAESACMDWRAARGHRSVANAIGAVVPGDDHVSLRRPQRGHRRYDVADAYQLWWSTRGDPAQGSLLPSYVDLSERFFAEVLAHPVPVGLRAIELLRGSPLRLDMYTWLTYRMSYLRRRTQIPWEMLRYQFGSDRTTNRQGRWRFRRDFESHLARVLVLYPAARVEASDAGLVLLPSRSHVAARPRVGLVL
jgi:hypothetical protein